MMAKPAVGLILALRKGFRGRTRHSPFPPRRSDHGQRHALPSQRQAPPPRRFSGYAERRRSRPRPAVSRGIPAVRAHSADPAALSGLGPRPREHPGEGRVPAFRAQRLQGAWGVLRDGAASCGAPRHKHRQADARRSVLSRGERTARAHHLRVRDGRQPRPGRGVDGAAARQESGHLHAQGVRSRASGEHPQPRRGGEHHRSQLRRRGAPRVENGL